MKLLMLFIALSLGNIAYQLLFNATPNYQVAFERSFFQGGALLLAFVSGLTSKESK